jgi:hypothetical protein
LGRVANLAEASSQLVERTLAIKGDFISKDARVMEFFRESPPYDSMFGIFRKRRAAPDRRDVAPPAPAGDPGSEASFAPFVALLMMSEASHGVMRKSIARGPVFFIQWCFKGRQAAERAALTKQIPIYLFFEAETQLLLTVPVFREVMAVHCRENVPSPDYVEWLSHIFEGIPAAWFADGRPVGIANDFSVLDYREQRKAWPLWSNLERLSGPDQESRPLDGTSEDGK